MRSARLDMALMGGVWVLPPMGRIAVYAPRAGDDLAALPQARVTVKSTFKPDVDAFAAQGYDLASLGPFAAALVFLPRAKAAARALLAEAAAALAPGGVMVVDGQKTDGIESMLRDVRSAGAVLGEVISKAHGKLALVSPPQGGLPAWRAAPQHISGGFVTLPGVFSADGPDRASQLLAAILPEKLPPRMADLGAGWGYLSRAVLERMGVKSLDIIEADADALACARQNIPGPRATFHWADATTFKPAAPWDMVVMNPPFHTARTPDAALGLGFIRAAHRGLAPNGALWMVANRQLPYTDTLKTLFRDVEEIGRDPVFRLIHAKGPIRAARS